MRDGDILISPKSDIQPAGQGLAVSGTTGEGLDILISQVRDVLSSRAVLDTSATHARHGDAMKPFARKEAALHLSA